MRVTRTMALIVFFFPPMVEGAPIFATGEWYIGDGGTYDASAYPNSAFAVESGTLYILPGANVLSAMVSGNGASILMTGGQVADGITVDHGTLNVSGGQASGYASSAYGGDAVFVSSSAQISGGTFTGGNSGGQAGSGVVASTGTVNGTPFLSKVTISGGTFIGGTRSGGYYGGSSGYSLLSLGDTTVTGGHFLSPIAINTAYGGETDFIGSHLTYQNNVLSGLLENGDPIQVQIYPNFTNAIVNASETEVSFVSSSSTDPIPSPIPEPSTALVFGLLTTLVVAH